MGAWIVDVHVKIIKKIVSHELQTPQLCQRNRLSRKMVISGTNGFYMIILIHTQKQQYGGIVVGITSYERNLPWTEITLELYPQ